MPRSLRAGGGAGRGSGARRQGKEAFRRVTGRRVGIEITPQAVRVAVVRQLGAAVWPRAYGEAPLAAGVFVPSWERENVRQEEAFRAALAAVLRSLGVSGARVRVALPDLTARLRIVESERPPSGPANLPRYAAWRLRSDLPQVPVRLASAFYLNGLPTRGYVAVLAAAAPALAQIERLMRDSGARPLGICSTGIALFNLLGAVPTSLARPGGGGGLLLVARPSATLVISSDGVPSFARTFRHALAEGPDAEAIAGLRAEVSASLDWCLDAGLVPPRGIALAGELASSDLSAALTENLGVPCHLAPLPFPLRGRIEFPPESIGALAAALG